MKTTQPKKKNDNRIVLEQPKSRTPRILQRSATFKSGKQYNRKDGKRVED